MTPGRLRIRFRLFWLTGVRNLMAHRLRVVLSAVGIAAGVALAVGVGAISSSIDASVRNVSQAAAAFANVEIRPPADVGMPAEILEEVRATEGVLEAGATIESFTFMRTADHEVRALVLGVDSGIASMAPREGDVQVFEDGNPLGLYLSPLLSTELGIHSAGEVEVNTTAGWQPLPIAGLLPDDGPVTRAAIGPIGTLKALSKQDGRVDAIYVRANDPGAVIQRLEESLGDRTMIGVPGFTSSIAQQLAGLVTMLFGGVATLSLFVGAFLVYNTMSMAAAARRKETALLRAVGARKGQLFRSFCAEGLVIGTVGALAGLALGVILARVLFVGQSSLLVEVFPQLDELALRPGYMAAVALVGATTAVAASALPALRTARTDPVVALRPVGPLEDPEHKTRWAALALGTLFVATAEFVDEGVLRSPIMFTVTALLMLGGVTLLLRALVPLAASLLSRLAQKVTFLPRTVRFAGGSVVRTPGRTTFTAGAIILALTLAVAIPMVVSSFQSSFLNWVDTEIPPTDVQIHPTQENFSPARMDTVLRDDLFQLPGVEGVTHSYITLGSIGGTAVAFSALHTEPPEALQRVPGAGVGPGPNAVPVAVGATKAALDAFGLSVGDTLEMSTPSGRETLEIAWSRTEPAGNAPRFIFYFGDFERIWGDPGVSSFGLFLSSETNPEAVKALVNERFGADHALSVYTRDEFLQNQIALLDGAGEIGSSITLLILVVAAIGMANTLFISTMERRREIGVLRAVGMRRPQVMGLVAAEALIVAVVGVAFAVIAGTLLGVGLSQGLQGTSGLAMPIVILPGAYITALVLGVVAALGASALPAHRAARAEITEAIQYE